MIPIKSDTGISNKLQIADRPRSGMACFRFGLHHAAPVTKGTKWQVTDAHGIVRCTSRILDVAGSYRTLR